MSEIVYETAPRLRFDSGQYPVDNPNINQMPPETEPDQPPVANQMEEDPKNRPSFIRKKLARTALTAALLFGGASMALDHGLSDTVNGRRALLIAEVASSDLQAAEDNLISGSPAYGSIQGLERMRMSDGLFKNGEFGFISSLWSDSRGEEALYIESLLHRKGRFETQYNQGLKSTIDNYGVSTAPGMLRLDQGVTVFHNESDAPYVDDGLWIAHDCLREYRYTHDRAYLRDAIEIFNSSISQWDNTRIKGNAMGGIYEQYQLDNAVYHYRATIANALAVSLGFELHKITGEKYFRADSIRIMNWVNQNLKDKADGLYFDRVYPNGQVVPAKYTYVQAEMVMAMLSAHTDSPGLYSKSEIINFIAKANSFFVNNNSYGMYSYFDSIWAEVLCYVASQFKQPSFTGYVKQVIDKVYAANKTGKNAITPQVQSPLLEQSGELALGALTRLPFNKWKYLSLA